MLAQSRNFQTREYQVDFLHFILAFHLHYQHSLWVISRNFSKFFYLEIGENFFKQFTLRQLTHYYRVTASDNHDFAQLGFKYRVLARGFLFTFIWLYWCDLILPIWQLGPIKILTNAIDGGTGKGRNNQPIINKFQTFKIFWMAQEQEGFITTDVNTFELKIFKSISNFCVCDGWGQSF